MGGAAASLLEAKLEAEGASEAQAAAAVGKLLAGEADAQVRWAPGPALPHWVDAPHSYNM